jgi:hypothetical protein
MVLVEVCPSADLLGACACVSGVVLGWRLVVGWLVVLDAAPGHVSSPSGRGAVRVSAVPVPSHPYDHPSR